MCIASAHRLAALTALGLALTWGAASAAPTPDEQPAPTRPASSPAARGEKQAPGRGGDEAPVESVSPTITPGAETEVRVVAGITPDPPQRVSNTGTGPAAAPDAPYFTDVLSVHRRGRSHCTGVLVADDLVLTAAHCLPADRVGMGQSATRPQAIRRVTASARAPDKLDAALLRLDRPLPLPARARRLGSETAAPHGEGRVVGFGAVDGAGVRGAGWRRFGTVWFDGWGCDRTRASVAGCRPADELVIAGGGGADTCDGDSGGPVFERGPRGWRLLAITARPVRAGRARCGDGGIYVRVDRLHAWIDDTKARWLGAEEER